MFMPTRLDKLKLHLQRHSISYCCCSWYLKISLYFCLKACLPNIRRWWAPVFLENFDLFLKVSSYFAPSHTTLHPIQTNTKSINPKKKKYVTGQKNSKRHCEQATTKELWTWRTSYTQQHGVFVSMCCCKY